MRWTLALAAGILVFLGSWRVLRIPERPAGLRIVAEVTTLHADPFDLFYSVDGSAYSPEHRVRVHPVPGAAPQELAFALPPAITSVHGIRLDPGGLPVEIRLHGLRMEGPYAALSWNADSIRSHLRAGQDLAPIDGDTARIVRLLAHGPDPQLLSVTDLSERTAGLARTIRPVTGPFLLALAAGLLAGLLVRVLVRPSPPRRRAAAPTFHLPRPRAWALGALAFLATYAVIDRIHFEDRRWAVEFLVTTPGTEVFELFYGTHPGRFGPERSLAAQAMASPSPQLVRFEAPRDSLMRHIRFDPGTGRETIIVHEMRLTCGREVRSFGAEELAGLLVPNAHVAGMEVAADGLHIASFGQDPQLICSRDLQEEFISLWHEAGNGPLPFLFALVAGLFALLSTGSRTPSPATGNAHGGELALSVLFVGMLSLPLISDHYPVEPKVNAWENRMLADRPELRWPEVQGFPQRYEAHYRDHFGFRKLLFRWNAFVHRTLLQSSPLPDRLVVGKGGFMFLNTADGVKRYMGLPVFDEEELEQIATRLEKRRSDLKARGIDYYLFIPPMKGTVYPDLLPDRFRPLSDRSGLDQLVEHLQEHTQVPVIDVRERLAHARERHRVYYASDIHWNGLGAFVGYQGLMERLSEDHPGTAACLEEDFMLTEGQDEAADLALLIALNDLYTRTTHVMEPLEGRQAVRLPADDVPTGPLVQSEILRFQGPDPGAPRLVMFRDSFGVDLVPLLSEHFSVSTYVWAPVYLPEVVRHEAPDIVVQELMEAFMRNLLHDGLVDPF